MCDPVLSLCTAIFAEVRAVLSLCTPIFREARAVLSLCTPIFREVRAVLPLHVCTAIFREVVCTDTHILCVCKPTVGIRHITFP